MNQIKEIIAMYLPSITSLAAIIISAATFLAKVKEIVGSTKNEARHLKAALANTEIENQKLKKQITEEINQIKETIKDLTVYNCNVISESNEVRTLIGELKDTQDLVKHLSEQVIQLAKKVGE